MIRQHFKQWIGATLIGALMAGAAWAADETAVDKGSQQGLAAKQLDNFTRPIPGAEWFEQERFGMFLCWGMAVVPIETWKGFNFDPLTTPATQVGISPAIRSRAKSGRHWPSVSIPNSLMPKPGSNWPRKPDRNG